MGTFDSVQWDSWLQEVRTAITSVSQAHETLTSEDKARSSRTKRQAFRHKLANQPKAAHREILETNDSEPGGPHSICHPDTGEIHHTQEEGVLGSVHAFYTTLMTPPAGPKT